MKALLIVLAGSWMTLVAAQSPPVAGDPAAKPAQSRPDARYPNPSGQDSQPQSRPSRATDAARSPKKQATADTRAPTTTAQSPSAQAVVQQKRYQGASGKKDDPGTACSTARTKPNGGVDCGTSGNGAMPGKAPH
jgi:hypothetical protein